MSELNSSSGVNRMVYQLWTGTNKMSEDREAALATSSNLTAPHTILYPDDIKRMELADHPFHPGYKYLSTNHRSDYLRSYLLNFYGGGYTDIKHYTKDNNWGACFDLMESNPDVDIIGVPEIPGGSSIHAYNNPVILRKLLGNCFMLCRAHSAFTEAWYDEVQRRMDKFMPALEEYGMHDDVANKGPGGEPSGYPIPYFGVQGDIFHTVLLDAYERKPSSVSNILRVGYNGSIRYR